MAKQAFDQLQQKPQAVCLYVIISVYHKSWLCKVFIRKIAVKSTMFLKLSVCMVWISMGNVIAHSNSAFK